MVNCPCKTTHCYPYNFTFHCPSPLGHKKRKCDLEDPYIGLDIPNLNLIKF